MSNEVIKQIKDKFQQRLINFEEHSARRIYLEIKPDDIKEVISYIFLDLKARFVIMTGMDTPRGIEILYHLSFDRIGKMVSVRTLLPDKNKLEIESITPILQGAEWIEREIWEMLGIKFLGHPNLKRLLLADDWPQGNYPLRRE
jgi:NADH:ubiquinone oxidoreductase subunit C